MRADFKSETSFGENHAALRALEETATSGVLDSARSVICAIGA
jgi:hypothetical protein